MPPPQPVMPIFARAYHAWSGLAVCVIGGIALAYVGIGIARMLPGGSLHTGADLQGVQVAETRLAALRQAHANIKSLSREDQLRLAALLPPEPDIVGIVTNIHNLTKATNLILQGVDANVEAVPPASLPAGVGSVAITVSLGGVDYPKLKIYLQAVSLNARLFDFVSVGFSPKTPDVSLQLRTYYVKR